MNNTEFFEALKLLEKEKGIAEDYLLEKIRAAIVIAVKRDFGGNDNVSVVMEPSTGEFSVALLKTVVEEVEDPETEMLPEEAVKYSKKAVVGDTVQIPLETKQFGRIAAQTAKHVIRQGIREAERGQQMQEFQRRNQELITALVTRVDPVTGAVTVEIGKAEAVLPKSEQIGDEVIREGQRIKVYVVDVREGDKGPRVLISRSHPGWSSGCLKWRSRRSSMAWWKSRRFPVKPVPAPSLRCSRTTKTWMRSVPASVRAARGWAASSRSSAARRSISWNTARIPRSSSPRRCRPQRC